MIIIQEFRRTVTKNMHSLKHHSIEYEKQMLCSSSFLKILGNYPKNYKWNPRSLKLRPRKLL